MKTIHARRFWAALTLGVLLILASLAQAEPLTISNTTGGIRASARLLDNANGVTDGSWTQIEGFEHFSVHISGVTGATVKVNISNSPAKPANSSHEIEAAESTTNAMVDVYVPVRWVKVRVSSYTSGSVTANLEALK